MTLCGLSVSGSVLATAGVGAALCVLLLLGAALGQWLERRYERRATLRRLRMDGGPSPWHAHTWQVAAGLEGGGVARCDCGAMAAVFVGGQG